MEVQDIYNRVTEDFKSTIITELIPGIIHNFANPLNGIIGRAQIMRRRIQQLVNRIEDSCPDALDHCGDLVERLIRDVEIINDESERFHRMFEVVGAKFQYLLHSEEVIVPLSGLLKTELSFAENYLKFKHQVEKELRLDDDLPSVRTVPAFLSICIWAVLRIIMKDIEKTQDRKLKISTIKEGNRIGLRIHYPVVCQGDGHKSKDYEENCAVSVQDIMKLLQSMGYNASYDVVNGHQILEIWFGC